jgi:hypothetical protein
MGTDEDGEIVSRYYIDDPPAESAVQRRNAATRERTQNSLRSIRTGGGIMMARVTPGVAHRISVECGGDPEKIEAWFRDHPEYLMASRSAYGLSLMKTKYFL